MNHRLAIASDYDGTIADAGRVSKSTLAALRRFRQAGHLLLLVTGRELDDLKTIFPEYDVFHFIVGENGALIYDCEKKTETLLAEPPPGAFLDLLREQRIGPLYLGRVIIATFTEHRDAIQQVIDKHRLQFDIIPNKEAIMVLPRGINKALGLRAALETAGVNPSVVAGVGDAENDEELLEACGFRVAVANALPALKHMADWVTTKASGEGVSELVERLLNQGIQAPNTLRKAQ